MRDLLKTVVGIALAALLLAFFLRGIDRRALGQALGSASLLGVALAALVNLAHNVFRTWRWGSLLEPVRPGIPFRPMFVAIIVGYLTTWVLPGRLGELVRPALLSSREKVPIGPCLGSVVADRILDGAAILLLFALGAWVTPFGGETAGSLRTAAVVMLIAVAAVIAGSIVAASFRGPLERFVEKRSGFLRWAGRSALSVALGTEALRHPRLLLKVSVHSVLAWLTIALGTWIGVRSSGAAVPFSAILVMLPILAFGVAVPTPGGAGGYHVAMKGGLTGLFGVPDVASAAAGILMHLAIVIPVLVLGMFFLKSEGLSWHDLVVAAKGLKHLGAESPVRASGAPEVSP